MLTLMIDQSVYAFYISIKMFAVGRGKRGDQLLRRFSDLQDAMAPIHFEHTRAEYLGKLATAEAAVHVHLPQAVLRRYVTLREKQVVNIRGGNVRHALRI